MDLPNNFTSDTVRVRVMTDDGTAPTGMALIPAGSFTMGDTFGEGFSWELPTHSVYISAFYMDKYEVTYTLWSNVHAWAITHGYSFDNAGSGKATNHPVQMVNWYDCVKWCNARSEMEGRTPYYYTSTNFIAANIYKTGDVNLSNDWVNWTTNGYRLPTEAEWEKAARGGLSGRRFPWQDLNITHTNANYNSTNSFSYDTSSTRAYHPMFATGVFPSGIPYTSPVGYFTPNDYGVYDMAGNVWEWTWDWYDSGWYGNANAALGDTPGPANGTNRVLRGGSWGSWGNGNRVATRNIITPGTPGTTYNYIGFRTVRR